MKSNDQHLSFVLNQAVIKECFKEVIQAAYKSKVKQKKCLQGFLLDYQAIKELS